MRRMSPSAVRPLSATCRIASAARPGSRSAVAAEPSASVTMTVRLCETMSCISRAMRDRSTAVAKLRLLVALACEVVCSGDEGVEVAAPVADRHADERCDEHEHGGLRRGLPLRHRRTAATVLPATQTRGTPPPRRRPPSRRIRSTRLGSTGTRRVRTVRRASGTGRPSRTGRRRGRRTRPRPTRARACSVGTSSAAADAATATSCATSDPQRRPRRVRTRGRACRRTSARSRAPRSVNR